MRSSTTQNCTVPWTKNNSMICTDPEDIEKAFSISWDRGTNQVIHIGNQSIFVRNIVKISYLQMKDCKKPCRSLQVAINGDNVFSSNETILRLYFESIFTKSQEKYLYPLRSLFAEIGGYVGIFLGYSLLSLGEVAASFLHSSSRGCIRKLKDKVRWIIDLFRSLRIFQLSSILILEG